MIIVCKDCPKRYQGCHAGCEWYKAERRVLDEENARRRAENADKYSVSSSWRYDKRGIR